MPRLDEAIDWYGRVLGFAVEKRFRIDAADAEAAMIRRGPLRLELFEVKGQAAPRRPTPSAVEPAHPRNKHGACQVNHLLAFITAVEEKGADVAFIVRESFGKACLLRDCAGNLIKFVEE